MKLKLWFLPTSCAVHLQDAPLLSDNGISESWSSSLDQIESSSPVVMKYDQEEFDDDDDSNVYDNLEDSFNASFSSSDKGSHNSNSQSTYMWPGFCQKAFNVTQLTHLPNTVLAGTSTHVDSSENVSDICPSMQVLDAQLIRSTLQGSSHGSANQDSMTTYCMAGGSLVMGIFDGHGYEGDKMATSAARAVVEILENQKVEPRTPVNMILSRALLTSQTTLANDPASRLAGTTAVLASVNMNGAGRVSIETAALGDSRVDVFSVYRHKPVQNGQKYTWLYKTQSQLAPEQNVHEETFRRRVAERFGRHGFTAFAYLPHLIHLGCKVPLRDLPKVPHILFIPNSYLNQHPAVDGCQFFVDCYGIGPCLPGKKLLMDYPHVDPDLNKVGAMTTHHWGFFNASELIQLPQNHLQLRFPWYRSPVHHRILLTNFIGLAPISGLGDIDLLFPHKRTWAIGPSLNHVQLEYSPGVDSYVFIGSDGVFDVLAKAHALDQSLAQRYKKEDVMPESTSRGESASQDTHYNTSSDWMSYLLGETSKPQVPADQSVEDTNFGFPFETLLSRLREALMRTHDQDHDLDEENSDLAAEDVLTSDDEDKTEDVSGFLQETSWLEPSDFPHGDLGPVDDDTEDAEPLKRTSNTWSRLRGHIRGCTDMETFGPEKELLPSLRFKGSTHLEQIAYGLRMLCLLGSDDCTFQILRLPNMQLK